MKWRHIKWKIKQFPNLIIRLVTLDHFYVCDECHCIHKRDGMEIRFDDDPEHLMFSKWWYSSVCREGFENVMNEVAQVLRDGLRGR